MREVKVFGENALMGNNTLDHVHVYSNMGAGVFKNCTGITSYDGDDQDIDNECFYGCTSLAAFNSSLASWIGDLAFASTAINGALSLVADTIG